MKALIVYTRVHDFQSRIFKQVDSLEKRGYEVEVLSILFNEKVKRSMPIGRNSKVTRIGLKIGDWCAPSVINLFLLVLTHVARVLRTSGLKLVQYNSVGMLGLHIFSFLRKKVFFIYAPHELESERSSAKGIKKKVSYLIEYVFIKRVNLIIVVGDQIATWYQNAFELTKKPSVLRNIPVKYAGSQANNNEYLRNRFGIPNDKMVFLYQGILERGRGISTMLKVFASNDSYHLVIMGFGSLKKEVILNENNFENIHYHEPVDPADIFTVTSSADIGFCLIENTCLSYYYSLPNKLFEYINSRVMIIGSAFPEIESIINQYNVGWAIEPDVESLRRLIGEIDFKALKVSQDNFRLAQEELVWDNDFAEVGLPQHDV